MRASIETPNMHILLGLPHGNRLGGVGSWTRNLAAELAVSGESISVLVHNRRSVDVYAYPENVKIVRLKGPPSDWAFRKDIAEVRRYLCSTPPTVFFPNGGHCGYAAAAQIKSSQKELRVVGMAHSDELPYYQTLQYYEPIIDRFVGVSYAIAEKLKSILPSDRSNDVICLPYGVPVPARVDRRSHGPLKLLYAGRIAEHQKKVSRLAVLSRTLESMGISFEFHVAGDGPERASLETAMPDRAVFHGSLGTAEVQTLMNRCDIIVQLSDFEGTSLTMLEGMASGMVPVMSAVSGIDAIIDHGVNGFLSDIGDVGQAATHIAALHKDRSLLSKASDRAREKIAHSFSIEANASYIASMSSSLLNEPSKHCILNKSAFPLNNEARIFWAKVKGKVHAELRTLFRDRNL